MNNLTKPIAHFDLETTSKKPALARIVSMTILKYNPDKSIEMKSMTINPGIPIPKESSDIHGILDEDVKDCPLFSQVAKDVSVFIEGCDLSAFNGISYDIPVLAEEFLRAGLELNLKGVNIVDPFRIFQKKEERNLSAALRFYTGETLEDAHSAEADTIAATKVLIAQTKYYPDLSEMSVEELADFCKYDGPERIDLSGVFLKDADGDAVYAFGKHQGKKVHECPASYLSWLMGDDNYTLQTKKVAEKMYNFYFNKKK